jgi:hypothetical protein
MPSHALTFFDGVAMCCSAFCAALAWIYRRESQRSKVRGYKILGASMAIGALAWLGSVFWGTLEIKGDSSDLTAAVPCLISVVLLLLGFACNAKAKGQSWKTVQYFVALAFFIAWRFQDPSATLG